MKDSEIVNLYWDRNEDALRQTQSKYGAYLSKVAYNILADFEDCKECVNDTYLRAWNSMPPHKPQRLSTFLGKITRNLAINQYKHYSAQKRGNGEAELILSELENCLPSDFTTEKAFDEALLIKAIEGFLQKESKERRIIFLKRYWYMCSVRKISDELKISEGKVKSVLFRQRTKLKQHLEKEGITI